MTKIAWPKEEKKTAHNAHRILLFLSIGSYESGQSDYRGTVKADAIKPFCRR